jgi:hypothetical protein
MSAEIVIYGAQIITGLATLVVVFVLVFQLKQQPSVAQRELVLAINQQRQDLAVAVANNPDLSDINFRGGHDFADLNNQSERIGSKNVGSGVNFNKLIARRNTSRALGSTSKKVFVPGLWFIVLSL